MAALLATVFSPLFQVKFEQKIYVRLEHWALGPMHWIMLVLSLVCE